MLHREQAPLAGNSLERVAPPVGEANAGAEDEHLHGAGDQNLTGAGERGDPGPHVDRQAGDLPAPAFHLARVQARPDLDAEVGYGIADGTCAADGPRRPVDGGEEAVSSGVDLHAAESLEEPPDVRVMVLQQVMLSAVAELVGPVRGADDVGEQDRGQAPVGYRGAARPGEELLDLIKDKPQGSYPGGLRPCPPGELNRRWAAIVGVQTRSAMAFWRG